MPHPQNHARFEHFWSDPPGWRGTLRSVNNQRLGARFMITALIFFGIGGILALLMRIQLAVSDNTFLSPTQYNQLFTMHGSTMMYLFAVPFLEGLALYLLPAMIGSRDVAFPRLTALSYWTYLFGGVVIYASFLAGVAPDVGWFAYTPLSGPAYSGPGTDFWLLGLALVEVAGLAAGVELVVTVLKLRAPGMTLARMPLFAWTALVAGVMMIFAFTPLLVASTLLELDRTADTQFFDPERGGSSLLWQHLFWFFGHPEVYIMFLPATGIISMVVPALARRPLAVYTLVATAVVLTGFVSFGLWMHHMYATGLPELGLNFFAAASLMIGIASGIQIFAWIGTLWGSRPAPNAALLYVLGFFFIFVLGGFTGVMIALVPFDWQVHDTFFIVAHFHYVLIGGVVFPVFAGLHYWGPKLMGRLLHEGWGRWSFWLNFIGFNLTFFPMHIMGFLGLPRRVYTYPSELKIDGYNLISTTGAFLLAGGALAVGWNFWRSWRRGPAAGDNPWGSPSLEWSVSSPPPIYTMLRPPVVASRYPLWDPPATDPASERAAAALTAEPKDWRATLSTDPVSARPTGIQILGTPSFLPLLSAGGLLLALLGVLAKSYLLLPVGILFAGAAISRWILPERGDIERRRRSDLPQRSGLPVFLTGNQSVGWWGMLSLVAIGATAFASLFYAYFYIWLFSDAWPQEGLPLQPWTSALAADALAVVAALLCRRGLRRHRPGGSGSTRAAFALALAATIAFVALGLWRLLDLPFGHRANAYASAYWIIAGSVLAVGVLQSILLGTALRRMGARQDLPEPVIVLHLQLTTLGSYFTAGVTAASFVVLHLTPRLL